MGDELNRPTGTSTQARLILLLKGMAMGLADSVPGVSGGTIAVICGIYEELINSIRKINPVSLALLWREGPRAWWQHINGGFLLVLLLGILGSLMLAANTVLYLLNNHYPLIMAFFIGLILASCWFLQRQVSEWTPGNLLMVIPGMAITLLLAVANPLEGSSSLVYLFFCGLIAICAMILPGISGAFILLLLGVYDYVLAALRGLQMDVIVVFAAGCACGLLSFAHLLAWTFRHYRQQTYAFLTGMLLASVYVLWPWKAGLDDPVLQQNLWPGEYLTLTGQDPRILAVLLLGVAGFGVILGFESLFQTDKGKDQ